MLRNWPLGTMMLFVTVHLYLGKRSAGLNRPITTPGWQSECDLELSNLAALTGFGRRVRTIRLLGT